MNRKRINELREQARATVFFFETAPVFFPVLHSCWSITLPQLTPGRRIAAKFARRTDALPEKYRYFSGFCFPAASAGVNKTLTRQRGSFDLKQNARGKVVRITEKVSSNRDRIMVPAEILDDFIAALQDIRETLKQQGE